MNYVLLTAKPCISRSWSDCSVDTCIQTMHTDTGSQQVYRYITGTQVQNRFTGIKQEYQKNARIQGQNLYTCREQVYTLYKTCTHAQIKYIGTAHV